MSEAMATQCFALTGSYRAGTEWVDFKLGVTHSALARSGVYVAVSSSPNRCIYQPASRIFGTMRGLSDRGRAPYLHIKPSTPAATIDKFNTLAAQWKRDKALLSSITAIAMLPSYQQIIGMGESVVPLILAQLERENDQPDMWFWALRSITTVDPVSEDDRGDLVAMAKSWIKWGHANGVS